MEGHVQSVEDNLIDSLSFKLKPGASYVIKRRSVSFWPDNGGTYSPKGGVRVIKISLKGDEWLDPSTCKFFFDITNNTALATDNDLAPLVSGLGVFSKDYALLYRVKFWKILIVIIGFMKCFT